MNDHIFEVRITIWRHVKLSQLYKINDLKGLIMKPWNHDLSDIGAVLYWAIKPSGSWSHCEFITLYTHGRWIMQLNIQNIIYLNCEETYEDMIDRHSYTHNLVLSSCEIKAWKNSCLRFKLMTPAIQVQCSTDWAIKPSGGWSHCKVLPGHTVS